MIDPSSDRVHATCIAIDGRAVLIEGRSGAGKSDLALRLIDRGAVLVSDDQTLIHRRGATLFAFAPETIRGRIEVRGLGILTMAQVDDVPVALIVTLDPSPARMPPPAAGRRVCGIDLPAVALPALEPSAPIKVELALACTIGDSPAV